MKPSRLSTLLLTALIVTGCSTSITTPNTDIKSVNQNVNKASEIKSNLALVKLTKEDIAILDKEYSFKTKSLSADYFKKKLVQLIAGDNGVANAAKIVQELEYARYKTETIIPFKAMIAANPSLYNKINQVTEVTYQRTINPPFSAFLDSASPIPTNIIYVNRNASGTNNGTSWANAYTSLQAALTNAVGGKDIWVAAGTYKPGTAVTDTFQLKDGVNIYGGFAGTETTLAMRNINTNIVILSGDINNSSSANAGDCYHVLKGANNTVLDGVTVKYGFANGLIPDNSGGGMLNITVSPTLTNVTFSNNSANFKGGGMYNVTNSSPVLTKVTFSGNSAADSGGGMYNNNSPTTLTNVTFTTNTAYQGGGMFNFYSSSTVTDTLFDSNSTNPGNGAGMYNYESAPTVTNVTFSNNSSPNAGGGMYNHSNASPILNKVTFSNNTAPGGGGGAMLNTQNCTPSISNTTFTSNSGYQGGAIYNSNSHPTIVNTTFYSNTATNTAGGIFSDTSSFPTVQNSIFWLSSITNTGNSFLKIGNSDVQGGFTAITNTNGGGVRNLSSTVIANSTDFTNAGNIGADPLFVNTANLPGADNLWRTIDDGLALQTTSPTKNTGLNAGSPTTDITGASRPKGGTVDMGAYEFNE